MVSIKLKTLLVINVNCRVMWWKVFSLLPVDLLPSLISRRDDRNNDIPCFYFYANISVLLSNDNDVLVMQVTFIFSSDLMETF